MAQTKIKLIADGVIDVNNLAAGHTITTDNIGEGSNLYYTNARVASYLATGGNIGIGTASPPNYGAGYITTAVNGSTGGAFVTMSNGVAGGRLLSDSGSTALTELRALPLVFQTSGTTKMLIDSSGNVGIGTTTPSDKLSVYTSTDYGNNSEYANATIGLGNGAFPVSIRSYRYGGSYLNGLDFYYNNGTPQLGMRITSAGNVGIGTSNILFTASGRTTVELNGSSESLIALKKGDSSNATYIWNNSSNLAINQRASLPIIFQIGDLEKLSIRPTGGITFNGDTAAANALDDYEEGTWAMGISFGGASVGITYSNNTGTYTKVGNKVTVVGYLSLSNKGSSTGQARITGLPYTIASGLRYYSSPTVWMNGVSFSGQHQHYGDYGQTTINLGQASGTGIISSITNANFSNTSALLVSFTYFV